METVRYNECDFLKELGPKSQYERGAQAFLARWGLRLTITYLKTDTYFPDDKELRNIYRWTLTNTKNKRKTSGKFGDSIHDTQENERPGAYDILSCLTKYDPGSFASFCSDFGTSEDSISGLKTYKAVRREFEKLQAVIPSEAWAEFAEIN